MIMVDRTHNDLRSLSQEVADVDTDSSNQDDGLFEQARLLLQKADASSPRRWSAFLVIISIGLFVLSFLNVLNVAGLSVFVGVILLHETGHYVGMRLFKFHGVQMFFIPFLGAAVIGHKRAV